MSIQTWIIEKLKEDNTSAHSRKSRTTVQAMGKHGVRVIRPGQQDAVGYCVDPDPNPFTVEMLEEAIEELPGARMVIVTRRVVDPDVYSRSSELGACVDTFGGFSRAITSLDDISDYVHPEETYFRKRMQSTRAVISVNRQGYRAWELRRINRLRSLTVVTHDRYELTDASFAEVLDQYPKLDIDALVVTNPSARGFGARVVTSSRNAGVPLYKLDDFISKVRDPWT